MEDAHHLGNVPVVVRGGVSSDGWPVVMFGRSRRQERIQLNLPTMHAIDIVLTWDDFTPDARDRITQWYFDRSVLAGTIKINDTLMIDDLRWECKILGGVLDFDAE